MKKIVIIDSIIICLCVGVLYYLMQLTGISSVYYKLGIAAAIGVIGIIVIDLIKVTRRAYPSLKSMNEPISELIALDEKNEPIRTWELEGRASLIIGRENDKEPVDVDLEDSEYSALIDYQHAVLNYAAGDWYVEDLYSQNGIRVVKYEDGKCYKIAKDRPCKLRYGDILLIANTKLMLR